MGISKVEELANCDIQRLTERFGKMGLWLKQAAHGLDFSEIEESSIDYKMRFKEATLSFGTGSKRKIFTML